MKFNNQSKALIISSLVMSIVLIISVIIYVVNAGTTKANINIAIVIVVLAILAVIIAITSKLYQQGKAKNLSDDYREAYDQICQHMGMSQLKFIDKREVQRDILSMFTEANHSGKTLEDVIGKDKDINKFSDEILEAYGVRNNYFGYLLIGLQYFLIYIVFIQSYEYFRETGVYSNYFQAKVEYTTLTFFALASFVIIPFVYYFLKKAMIKGSSVIVFVIPLLIVPLVVGGGFIITIEFIKANLLHINWVYNYYNGSTAIIRNIFTLILMFMLYIGSFYVKRRINKRPF